MYVYLIIIGSSGGWVREDSVGILNEEEGVGRTALVGVSCDECFFVSLSNMVRVCI
jgi:hypothetical protein